MSDPALSSTLTVSKGSHELVSGSCVLMLLSTLIFDPERTSPPAELSFGDENLSA